MIPVSFEEVSARYPAAVSQVVQLLRAGVSQSRDMPPERMQWAFTCGPELPIPHVIAPPVRPYPALLSAEQLERGYGLSPEEAREYSAMHSAQVRLYGKALHWRGKSDYISVPHETVPFFEAELHFWLGRSTSYIQVHPYIQRELRRFQNILGAEYVESQIQRAPARGAGPLRRSSEEARVG